MPARTGPPTPPHHPSSPASPVPAPRRRHRAALRWQPLALGAALALAGAALPLATRAAPVVTAEVQGSVLVVAGSAEADTIVVISDGVNVKVNGADPSTGAFPSNQLTGITISAGDGADTIDVTAVLAPNFALTGAFSIDAGADADTVVASPAFASTISGGAGDDRLLLTADATMLIAGQGVIDVGTVRLTGSGFEAAQLIAGAGANTLDARAATIPVDLYGLGGADALLASPDGGLLDGGEGDDALTGAAGTDLVVASAGSDTVAGVQPGDILQLAADADITLTDTQLSWGANSTLITGSFAEAQLTGGPSANVIDASAYSARVALAGRGGADTLIGGAGSDALDGGADADTIVVSAGYDNVGTPEGDTLRATRDSDMDLSDGALQIGADFTVFSGSFAAVQLTGGPGANTISADGYAGPTTISGEGGNDTLSGGGAADTISGGPGDDSINGDDGDDTLSGGTGNDTLTGGTGNDTLSGDAGNDSIDGGAGADSIDGGADDDTLTGGLGADSFLPSPGSDTIADAAAAQGDTLRLVSDSDITLTTTSLSWGGNVISFNGSFGELRITGGPGDNRIDASAFDGPVAIAGLGGNDTLLGGSGNDAIEGGDGDDTIGGGLGNDAVDAGAGDDNVDGNGSAAQVAGPASDDDALNGGPGRDTLRQTADADQTLTDTRATGSGSDTLSNFETALLTGGAANNTIDASGFGGPVTIDGLGGDDTLTGGAGDDTLVGGPGNDTLTGGAGNDILDGGDGDDLMVGGDGIDEYRGGAGDNRQGDYQLFLPKLRR